MYTLPVSDEDHQLRNQQRCVICAVGPWSRLTMHLVICIIVCGLAIAGPVLARERKIVVLGDSNTAGWGVGEGEAFPSRLESKLRRRGQAVQVLNAGVPGDTTGGMLSRVDESVPSGTELVIVQGGYNDLVNGVPPRQMIGNLRTILSKLHGRHIKTVLCGSFYKYWDAVGRRLAASSHSTFAPGVTCYDPRYKGFDGLHMSADGHEVVAARLERLVGSNSESRPRSAHGRDGAAKRTVKIGRRARSES